MEKQIAPFVWESYTSYNHLQSKRDHGTWKVGAYHKESHTEFSWERNLPEGETLYTMLNKPRIEMDKSDPVSVYKYWKQASYSPMGRDLGRGYSQGETQYIVELAEQYCEVEGTVDQILTKAGFVDARYTGCDFTKYGRKIGSGEFDITVHNTPMRKELSLHYSPPKGNRWHNILSISEYCLSYDNSCLVHNFFPEMILRPLETFAMVATKMADLRALNGPRSYHKPAK